MTSKGTETISKMIFWRSKAGMRKVGYAALRELIEESMPEHTASKSQVWDMISAAYSLALARVAPDEEN